LNLRSLPPNSGKYLKNLRKAFEVYLDELENNENDAED
jgi:hypothetical protein